MKMTELQFKLDLNRDAFNIWELCNAKIPWEEPNEKKIIQEDYKNLWRGKSFEESKKEIEQSVENLYSRGIVEAFRKSLEDSWKGINQEYFDRLEKVTGRPVFSSKFIAYATTAGRCPYNPKDNSFMISIRRPLLQCMRIAGHELMHLQFHNYFWDEISSKIGDKKTLELSESLTNILNLEFRDLWLVADEGYPSHSRLRDFIKEKWKENPCLDFVVKESLEYLKRDYDK